MPPVELLLHARPRDIGGFSVRRALPSMQRRLVGPFIFWDHMGPTTLEPDHGMDVRPHPHIGLATVTYLFEGEIVHKDSLGNDQAIQPGAVNLMVAGRGIVHSERTGPEVRRRGSRVHGIQSWVAMPAAAEESAPTFEHHAASTLPETSIDGVRLRVLAGSAYGLTGPARVLSPTFYVEATMPAGSRVVLPEEHEERALYVVEGEIECGGEAVAEADMAIAGAGAGGPEVVATAKRASRVMLLGGAKMDGARHIFWNFVSSSKERIEQAKRDWKERRFERIPGDDVEFVPLPE